MLRLLRLRSSFLEKEDSYLWKLFDEMQMIIGGNVFEGRLWISSKEIILSPYRYDKPVKKILIRDILSFQESGKYIIIMSSKAYTLTEKITTEENVELGVLNIKPFLHVLKILQKLQYDPSELSTQIEEYENSFPCPTKLFGEPVVEKSKAYFLQNDLRISVQVFHSPFSTFVRPYLTGKITRVPYEMLEYVIRSKSHTDVHDHYSNSSKFEEDSGNSLIFVSKTCQDFNFQLIFHLSSVCETIYDRIVPAAKKCPDITEIAEKWKARELSTREFVVYLNRLAGRTFHQSKSKILLPRILKNISDPSSSICTSVKEKKERKEEDGEEEEENEGEEEENPYFDYALQRRIFCPEEINDRYSLDNPSVLPAWCNGNMNLFLETARSVLEGRVVSSGLHIWVKKTFNFEPKPRDAPLFIPPEEKKLSKNLSSLKSEIQKLNKKFLSQGEELARREVKFRETKQDFRKVLLEKTEEIQGLNDVNLEILEMVKRTSVAQDRVRNFVNMKQEKLEKMKERYHTRTNYVDHLLEKIKKLKERERNHANILRVETERRGKAEGRAKDWETRANGFQERLRGLRTKQKKLVSLRTERVMETVSMREEELGRVRYELKNKNLENQSLRQELRRALLNLSKIEKKVQETEGLREKIGLFGPNPFGFRSKKRKMKKNKRNVIRSIMIKSGGKVVVGSATKSSSFMSGRASVRGRKTKMVLKKKWKRLHGDVFGADDSSKQRRR